MSRYRDEYGEPLSPSDAAFETHGDPLGGYRYPKDRCALGGLLHANTGVCSVPDCRACRPAAPEAVAA